MPRAGPSSALLPGLYTTYTAHLHRDKALLTRLLRGLRRGRPADTLTTLLRGHLLELTQSFVIPLVRSWGGGLGSAGGCGPGSSPPPAGALHGRPHASAEECRALEGEVQGSEVAWGGAPILIPEEGSSRVWRRPQGPRNGGPTEELEAPSLGCVPGRVGAQVSGSVLQVGLGRPRGRA